MACLLCRSCPQTSRFGLKIYTGKIKLELPVAATLSVGRVRHEVVVLPPDELPEQADGRPRPPGRRRRPRGGRGHGVPDGAGGEAAQRQEGRQHGGGRLQVWATTQ